MPIQKAVNEHIISQEIHITC